MTNTLLSEPVRTVLDRLHAAAAHDDDRPLPWSTEDSFANATAAERADGMREVYMPISAQAGALFYALVRSARPRTVVEFGTSFGVSTLYLAAALADNGNGGHVISTELSADKAAAARANLDEAGLADRVTIVQGDALSTLADLRDPVDLLFLDGWKDLYLPLLDLLQDRLTPGALVLADDTEFASVADYLAHVRRPDSGYVTVNFPVEDGVEISCWTGRG